MSSLAGGRRMVQCRHQQADDGGFNVVTSRRTTEGSMSLLAGGRRRVQCCYQQAYDGGFNVVTSRRTTKGSMSLYQQEHDEGFNVVTLAGGRRRVQYRYQQEHDGYFRFHLPSVSGFCYHHLHSDDSHLIFPLFLFHPNQAGFTEHLILNYNVDFQSFSN